MITDRTRQFATLRAAHAERRAIVRTKLENRLATLLRGVQALTAGSERAGLWGWSQVDRVRAFEQRIVPWEDERVFERCRFCGQRFTLTNRRHHCRVCGLVTCGDAERECSLEVPLAMLGAKMHMPEVSSAYPLRVCTECRRTLFALQNYEADCAQPPPALLRLHGQLKRHQRAIDALMPAFRDRLQALDAGGDVAPLKAARHALLKEFSRYEALTARVRALPMETLSEAAVKEQCLAEATQYMERAMQPLRDMRMPAAMQYNETRAKNKAEATRLQNELLVLEEQQYLLEQQLATAKAQRHFDAVLPLNESLAELNAEITQLRAKIEQLG